MSILLQKKKSLIIPIVALCITAVIVIGFLFIPGNNLNVDLDDTIGDDEYSCSITGLVELLDIYGNPIYTGNSFVQYALADEGTVVESVRFTLGWTTTGTEIDWATFIMYANPTIILDDPFGDPQILSVTIPVPQSSSIFYNAEEGLVWVFDLTDTVVDELGTDTLTFFTGVRFTFEIDLTASVTDIYGDFHTASTTVSASFVLDWESPTFGFDPFIGGVPS